MKPMHVILLSLAISAVTAYAVGAITQSDLPAVHAVDAPDGDVARMSQSIAALETQQKEIARTLADLRAELSAAPRGDARLPLGEIEAAVARALEKRDVGTLAARATSGEKPAAKPKRSARSAFTELQAGDLSDEEVMAVWKDVVANGGDAELLALYEQYAADNPNDAQAQVDLGQAYLQKLFTVNDGPEKGTWAVKADQSFDKALGIDDQNWEARFSKAVSLSFWPPVFGKTGEAIHHFEVLVGQQASAAVKPSFAQTHLLLGNLYLQQGQKDKAIGSWQKGLTLFPDDADLQQQIANAQSH